MTKKLWGGRFQKGMDKVVEDFHSSIHFDQRLYRQDIRGSIAHARMLGNQEIIPAADAQMIIAGLQDILADIEAGKVEFDVSAEDIHMNIEKLLTERIGETGKKLHTARSRNDQVALDIRLYLRDECTETRQLLAELIKTLLDVAEENLETIMPGYTHLQKAQPITLAHHLLAYVQMFERDRDRFADVARRLNRCPLGSGALAGTTFHLDRQAVADELNFDSITENSLDAVADRDFAIEYTAAASLTMMHLSRFCEEIILWSSQEFAFIDLDDAYATGSSMMPQKKNPDLAELIRGKTGRVYGDLMALLTVMKALPLAYNKDMQEDKETLFDAVDTVKGCLTVFTPMIRTMGVRKDKMRAGASGGFTNATDVADYLAKKGVSFREAHEVVGKMVLMCVQKGVSLDELTWEEYQACSPAFEPDIYEAIKIEKCVADRHVPGGPAPQAVRRAIEAARARLC
ncbi:argininosuccinate lyase [Heliophilum fasciatum]|uniref:Argininosuccinate lyase n=1 Tax=Heliophilum fasciatum TaxID=35700 RepID=A0A4R2RRI8_9FIRM|nr:argininosuccinate lyase [Heliophilum fasciatum]MCW2278964.1 argininosuccinate lyase [Heliophilum fasciatum]TCP61785.1 argininosuccinate lyase [Heliophilum fasciatum]